MGREVAGSRSRLIAIVVVFLVLTLSSVFYGCSGSSEVIVGKWESDAFWTEDNGFEDYYDATLNIGSSGSVSLERPGASQSKVSGNWQTVPKSDWPPAGELNIVGYYKINLQFGDHQSTYGGIVARNDNGSNSLMLLGNGVGILFVRAS